MKVNSTYIRKIEIEEAENLDKVCVYVEEPNIGEAKVTIEVFGKSWCAIWSSMGGDLKSFFDTTSVEYLVNCFDRGISATTNKINILQFAENLQNKIKSTVIDGRKEGCLEPEEARAWFDYDFIGNYGSECFPEHSYDTFKIPEYMDEYFGNLCSLFYDEDSWDDFCRDIPVEYLENGDYIYLHRIVTAVKDGFKLLYGGE